MTLMEIMVVMAIIGAMVALGVSTLREVFDVDLEKAATEFSSTMRYLYGEAARRNEIYRLGLNMDEASYVIESAPNTPKTLELMAETGGTSSDGETEPEAQPTVKERRSSDTTSYGLTSDAAPPPPSPGFTPPDDPLLKPKKLSTVFFKDVFVSHLPEKVEQGIVYIYFFPNGSTEYAIINLKNEDETAFYSVELNPLTGKTKLRSEYYENPY